MKFENLHQEINNIFKEMEKEDIKDYSLLKYPHHFSIMKMNVFKYNVKNFGSIMVMNTNMLHMMKLTTISFTPNSGINAPFLLVDTMSVGKKRLAFVEFYNTTNENYPNIEGLSEKYDNILEYQEHDNWYVSERMKGSLIKSGTKKDEDKLVLMIVDCLNEYKKVIDNAGYDVNNIERLKSFANRMLTEGNPSTKTLNKVLKEEKARDFFEKIIMPVNY